MDDAIEKISNDLSILITGDSGIGKTSIAYVIANELNLSVVEINPSDCATKEQLSALSDSIKTKPIFGKTLYLFDEADIIKNKEALYRLIQDSVHPIILTANNAYQISYKIKKYCKHYTLQKPKLREIVARIRFIAQKEGIKNEDINFSNVTHDVRSSIISSFDNTRPIKTEPNDFDLTRKAFIDQEQVDLNPAWLMDNVHNFYHGIDVYNALKVITYAIELDDNYLYTCLPKSTRGKPNYPYYLRRK